MGEYVDLPGVKTWYEVEGDGDPLVLLHGGICTNDLWGAQRPALAARYRVYLPERRANGHTPDVEGPLHLQDMATDTIDFIETVVGGPAHLVGWSDGAVVALLVAIGRPDLVRKIVSVGANFLPAPQAGVMPEMLDHLSPDAPDLAMLRELYAAASPDGADHWAVVLEKHLAMWRVEPNISLEDLGRIRASTLVVASDDDQMTLEHTITLHRAIRGSELAIVPGTSHALLMEKADSANKMILDFLGNGPAPTMMPILRATADAGT